ncbi:MAG: hypothetical protein RL383_1142 [Actinomycetota bacterium]
MCRWKSVLLVSLLATTCAVSGCSDSSTGDDTQVMTGAELAGLLLSPGDIEGEWTLNKGPEGGGLPESGEITDADRDQLPQVQVCDKASAAAKEAISNLRWQAYRQLDRTENDPLDPPKDREGHMEFVQQYLMSDEPSRITTLYGDAAPGFIECLGDIPAGEEGPGTSTEVQIGQVGDERVAVLSRFEEAGGTGMWNIYSVLVRKGAVLVSVTAVDIVMGDLEAELTLSDVSDIVETAVSKL